MSRLHFCDWSRSSVVTRYHFTLWILSSTTHIDNYYFDRVGQKPEGLCSTLGVLLVGLTVKRVIPEMHLFIHSRRNSGYDFQLMILKLKSFLDWLMSSNLILYTTSTVPPVYRTAYWLVVLVDFRFSLLEIIKDQWCLEILQEEIKMNIQNQVSQN